MAKTVKEVQNGDVMSNVIVLRSVYGKVGQKYYIQPQKDSRGRYPSCVKRVDSHGDIILTPEELELESKGKAAYIPEDTLFVIEDGKTFDLTDVREKAEWEAIQYCDLIAPDRFAKNSKGESLIDGVIDPKTKMPRYGIAELYIDRPGFEAQQRVTKKKLILQASNYIMNDERGYDGRILVAKVLSGRDMRNQPNADVEDYLLSIAEKTPEKIIDCYTGGDMKLRILFIEAREKGVIYKKSGLYLFGEDGKVILGATDDAAVEWMKDPKNSKTVALIRKEAFQEMFE